MRQIIALSLAFCFIFTVLFSSVVFAEPAPEDAVTVYDIQVEESVTTRGNELWTEEMSATLNLACEWLRYSELKNLYFTCLGASGKTAVSSDVNQYITDIVEQESAKDSLELSYHILNVTFSGYNATNVLGRNFIEELSAITDFSEKNLYPIAYALLAINSNQYEIPPISQNTPDRLISLLLQHKSEDGGFRANKVARSDVVNTALALTALAPYRHDPAVSVHIEDGLEYLSQKQQDDGSFPYYNPSSSVATSKVIVALSSLDIPLTDARFVKNEETLQNVLLRYANTDGGFCDYRLSDSDMLATESAILALASIKRLHSPYQMETQLVANSSRAVEQVLIIEKAPIDFTKLIMNTLLFLLAAVLVFALLRSRFHPLRYWSKKEQELATEDSVQDENKQD